MCHDIASPSLSGSVARYTESVFCAADKIDLICFLFSGPLSHSILKSFSISMALAFDGYPHVHSLQQL